MKATWFAVMVCSVAAISSCMNSRETESADSTLARLDTATEEDLLEALFRYLFEHNASSGTANRGADSYFLSIRGNDPSPDFLSRFEQVKLPVRPGSQFEIGKGVMFRVDEVKRIDGRRVEIEGGYYEARQSSSGNTYVLEKRGGCWRVTADRMHWISLHRATPTPCEMRPSWGVA